MEGGTSKSTYPNGKTFYTGADPVNALTGAFLWSYTWLEDYGKDNLAFITMYDSQRDDSAKVLGKKWTYSLNYLLSMDEKNAYFSMPSGGVRTFRIDKEYGTFPSASGGYPSYSMKKNEDGSYSVCEHGGREFIFDSNCCLNRIVKNTLVEYGFRLPSAYDNRPLNFEEFYKDFTSGVDYDEIIDEAVEFAYKHLEERPQYEIESLTNYENMKDKLVMEIQAKSTFIFSAYYKTK